jgi:hypothetical protein
MQIEKKRVGMPEAGGKTWDTNGVKTQGCPERAAEFTLKE